MAEEVDQRLLTPEELVTLSVVESHTIPTMQHSLLAPEAGHVQELVQIIRRLTLKGGVWLSVGEADVIVVVDFLQRCEAAKPSLGDGPYADYQ